MSSNQQSDLDVIDGVALMSRDELATALGEVDDVIDVLRTKMLEATEWQARLKDRLVMLTVADGATIALAGEYTIERVAPKPVVERRVDVLRQLYDLADEGVLPRAAVEKAVYLEQPPPTWKVNLTSLRPLAKYGSRVTNILARGLVETTVGAVTWKFTRARAERNVTPKGES